MPGLLRLVEDESLVANLDNKAERDGKADRGSIDCRLPIAMRMVLILRDCFRCLSGSPKKPFVLNVAVTESPSVPDSPVA